MRRLLLLGAAVLAALAVAAYAGVSWYMVDQAVVAERNPIETTPAAVGLRYEDVAFQPRGARLTLRGWYVPAEGAANGLLVLVHGLDSTRARDGKTYLEFVRDLHSQGFRLLLFDLRAHGESEGKVLSAGYYEKQDLLGALDFATGVQGERWERVGVLGFSLGAAIALLAAEQEPRLRALAADSSFASLSDLIAKETADRTPLSETTSRLLLPGMVALARLRYGIPLDRIRPVESIGRLDYPLLLIHTEGDSRIPVEQSRRLIEAARDPGTELWVVPGTEHAIAYKAQPQEYLRRVADYFRARFAAAQAVAGVAA